jgi:plastocyanin
MRNAALIATCALVTAAATAETHVVSAYDMTFVPEIVEVNVGDTIRWEYVSGSPHTVSTGDSCRFDGLFFAALSFIEPVFEWVVPEGGAVTIPYFCAPHCINGMVGTIHVVQPCEGELTGDGDVGGDDLLVVLSNWGGDDPSGDVDGNGIVDGEDLLILLGNWGPCG